MSHGHVLFCTANSTITRVTNNAYVLNKSEDELNSTVQINEESQIPVLNIQHKSGNMIEYSRSSKHVNIPEKLPLKIQKENQLRVKKNCLPGAGCFSPSVLDSEFSTGA